MKNIKICIILLLLFGFTSVFAQGTQSAKTENTGATKSLEDPKLSPEEQALRLTAGEDNPAKIDESTQLDPRMTPEEQAQRLTAGEDNPAKIDESTQVDPRLSAEPAQKEKQATPDAGKQISSGADQPAGETGGIIPDYRNMNGSNDQPKGEQPADVTNYRDMHGSDQQPAGDTPKK